MTKTFKITIGILILLALAAGGVRGVRLNQKQQNNKEASFKILTNKKILYKKGNELISYSPATKEKITILTSTDLLDFDLSRDGKFIAYSLKEKSFDGDSDIYLKNLETGEAKRLAEKNDIVSFNPKIFPDNSKVAYVRRTYDPITKKLSDGEIWMISSDGNIESSQKLFSPDIIEGLEVAQECVTEEEKRSAKIGISDISPDGMALSYWNKEWGIECSGLWEMPRFSKLDGIDFFTEKFKKENTFLWGQEPKKEYNWVINKLFWFDDGTFVISQSGPTPIAETAIYYYDKEQNKKWEVFDDFKQDTGKYGVQTFINDIVKIDDDHFVIAYWVYKNMDDIKHFAEELTLSDKIDLSNLDSKKYFAIEKYDNNNDRIFKVKILGSNSIIYVRQVDENRFALYLYNISSNREEKIDESNSKIEFDF